MLEIFLSIPDGISLVAAGINHFVHPKLYMSIMPPWLPAQGALVAVSGVLEILLGLLLILPKTRKLAAWGLVLLLIAVLPANVQMSVNYHHEENPRLWIVVLRLPLQLLLIWWAYKYTKPMSEERPGV